MFITFVLLVSMPLIIISICVHQIFSTSKLEDITTNTENTIIQLNNSLDLMVEDAARTTLSLLYNKQLTDLISKYSSTPSSNYRNNKDINTFSLFLSGIMYNRETYHGVHLFSNQGHVFSHLEKRGISDRIVLKDQPWYKAVNEADGAWILFPESSQSYYSNDETKYVSFIRLLKDPATLKVIGIFKIDFSPQYIKKLTNQIPGKNWQIISNKRSLFKKEESQLLNRCSGNKTWITDNDEQYLCISHISPATNIKVNNIISKDYLYKDIREFNQLLVLLIIICIITLVILSFYVTKRLLKPFEILKNRIRDFQNTKMKIDGRFTGEIAELSHTYNDMVSEIDQLVEEIYELNQRNAESEYKTLQSKMDPHFIFNTLESINMTALSKRQFKISDMVSELGSLIRYRLNNDETFITLQSEVNFSKSYALLMKQRLGDIINVEWDIDKEALQQLIPKYLIQPLIENAIKHGYNNKILTIKVSAKLQGETLNISVSDDGKGLEKKHYEKLLHAFSEDDLNNVNVPQQNGNGIALVNISRRLSLIYGKGYSLKVNSKKTFGAVFHASIPIQRR